MEARSTSGVLLGVALALGLIGAAFLFGRSVVRAVPSNQVVKVRGVASRTIDSDRVRWRIHVTYKNRTLETAYKATDDAVAKVDAFLKNAGVPPSAIQRDPYSQREVTRRVILDKFGNDEYRFEGYEVGRVIEVDDFKDLDLVEKLALSFSEEIQRKGIQASTESPYFYYSKPVGDIKPDLLRGAAENAYERATIVAESSGSDLGPLRAARQGAFEGFGDAGYVGGYSRKHRVTAIVTVDYALR